MNKNLYYLIFFFFINGHKPGSDSTRAREFPRYEGCHPVVEMLHGVKNRTDLLTRHWSNITREGVLLHDLWHLACSFVPTAASHLWSCSVQEHNRKCDIAFIQQLFLQTVLFSWLTVIRKKRLGWKALRSSHRWWQLLHISSLFCLCCFYLGFFSRKFNFLVAAVRV